MKSMVIPLYLFLAGCLIGIKPVYANNYRQNNYWQPLYTTNTAYRFVKNLYGNITENRESTASFGGRTYHIVNLYLFIRHGSRTPQMPQINGINKLYNKIKTNRKVINKNLFLRNWVNPFTEESEYKQYEAGNEEQRFLAQKYGKMFRNLFDGNLNRIKYTVTKTNVSVQSYISFYDSLSDLFRSDSPRPTPVTDMKKLHFYDLCKKFDRLSDSGRKQYNKFLGGHEIRNVLKKVGRKLGARSISTDDLIAMRQYCAFELQVFDRSRWCSFFDIEDLRVIEYLFDLLHYWQVSYGLCINRKMSCPLTSDIFQTLDRFVQSKEKQNRLNISNINFSHGFSLFRLYTALEILPADPPLFASDYELNRDRLFRASIVSPMSASLAVALYKSDDYVEDYVVKMFVNEEPIVIPRLGCTVCPYHYFRWTYKSLTSCEFDKICENNEK